jgi:hypothetical protein
MDRPRYMNVPSPAPCHVNVAGVGVGKQSVWGPRIIAYISSFYSHMILEIRQYLKVTVTAVP